MKNLNEIQLSVVNPSLNIIVNDLKHEIEEENKKYGCFEKREKFYILGSSLSFIYAFISIIYFFINLFVGDLKFHHLIMLLSATFVSYLFVNLLEQNDIKNKSAKIKKNKILEIEKYTDNIYYCRLSDNEKNFLKRHSLTKDSYVEIYKLIKDEVGKEKLEDYILEVVENIEIKDVSNVFFIRNIIIVMLNDLYKTQEERKQKDKIDCFKKTQVDTLLKSLN